MKQKILNTLVDGFVYIMLIAINCMYSKDIWQTFGVSAMIVLYQISVQVIRE